MTASDKAAASRAVMIVAVTALIALLCAANAHLVYVSFASEPDCVPHRRMGERPTRDAFAAAASACTPSILSDNPWSER